MKVDKKVVLTLNAECLTCGRVYVQETCLTLRPYVSNVGYKTWLRIDLPVTYEETTRQVRVCHECVRDFVKEGVDNKIPPDTKYFTQTATTLDWEGNVRGKKESKKRFNLMDLLK